MLLRILHVPNLQLLVGAVLVLCLSRRQAMIMAVPCDFDEYYDTSSPLDAIVVGAGMSGLAAAATLLKRNKNVLVLEGRHEVGGRMRTLTGFGEESGDFKGTIELGANWIYGGYGDVDHYDDPDTDGPINPIKNFCLDAGVTFMEEVFNGRGIDMYDLTRPGPNKRLPFPQLREKLANFRTRDRCVSSNAVSGIFTMLRDNPELGAGSKNVREAMEACGFPSDDTDAVDGVLEVTWYDNEVLSLPEDASEMSFIPWGYEDFGGQVLFIKGQNGGLTEVARKYGENNDVLPHLVYNAKVTNIDYTTDPARVTVSVNGGEECYVDATKVIFTGSPGVVDKHKDTLFTPPIANTGIRQVDLRTWVKVFFQFPTAFWNGNPRPGPFPVDQFNYIMTAQENNRAGCNVWFNFDYVTEFRGSSDPRKDVLLPGSRVLFGWMPQHIMDEFGGSPNYVFNCDDTDGDVARLLEPLKLAYGDDFEMPTACYATDWQNDEFTYGSWNAFNDDPSLDNTDYYDFYEPRNGRLWLSGASSCRRSYRNMQGAYFAGVRDANWVADCLDNPDEMPPRPEQICDIYKFPLVGGEMEGDPHVKTWGGKWFDYHGQCDLVLLHAPNFDSHGRDLSIHVRTTIRYDYSYIESAAIQIGNDVLEVASFGDYALNGVDTPHLRPNNTALSGYAIHYTEFDTNKHTFDVVLGQHMNITFSTYKDLVKVAIGGGPESDKFFHKSVGIMGSFTTGTLYGRDGVTVMDDMNALGQEWQVGNTDHGEPMLFRQARIPQYPNKCMLPKPAEADERRRRLAESVPLEIAISACSHLSGDRLKNCVFDVQATRDVDVAQTYHR